MVCSLVNKSTQFLYKNHRVYSTSTSSLHPVPEFIFRQSFMAYSSKHIKIIVGADKFGSPIIPALLTHLRSLNIDEDHDCQTCNS